jgi:hypothetical protein
MIMDPGLVDRMTRSTKGTIRTTGERPADTQSKYAKIIEPGAARWSELSSGETA